MIQHIGLQQVEHAARCAGAGIGGGKHQSRYPGVNHRPGAHRTGLQSRIQGAGRQPIIAAGGGGGPQRQHFGMGGRIADADGLIPTLAQHLAIPHQHRAHRHFAGRAGPPRQFQGAAHPVAIPGVLQLVHAGHHPDSASVESHGATGRSSVQRTARAKSSFRNGFSSSAQSSGNKSAV